MIACWLLSVRLVPGWKREGWPSLLRSLYGLVWIDFGLVMVLRFAMLAYNAVEWGNGTLRLVAIPADTIDSALAYCWMFWVLLVAIYALVVRRHGTGPLTLTHSFDLHFAYQAAIPFSLFASVIFFLVEGPGRLPLALVTPLALLANLYLVTATIVWWDHFRRPGPKWRIGSIHVIVLLPALVHGVLSPYRENLAPILIVPLIAAMFAGHRPRLTRLVPAALICFLLLTTVVGSYRKIKWENVRPQEVAREFGQGDLGDWIASASEEPAHRFHAFDSLLLTVSLVPALEPYSERNVLVSSLVRGVVPRFLYSDKSGAEAGLNFGARIWAFDDPAARENSGASIAPSMPGDLYDAGGVLYIALGALIWGALLGLVDGWKRHLPPYCAAAITVLVATQCAMSIERDFDNSIATFIQTLLVFVLVGGVLALVRRDQPHVSHGLNPILERP